MKEFDMSEDTATKETAAKETMLFGMESRLLADKDESRYLKEKRSLYKKNMKSSALCAIASCLFTATVAWSAFVFLNDGGTWEIYVGVFGAIVACLMFYFFFVQDMMETHEYKKRCEILDQRISELEKSIAELEQTYMNEVDDSLA